jgi:uncharacterized membrane protein
MKKKVVRIVWIIVVILVALTTVMGLISAGFLR